ncbi:MAG: FAD-binding oxidoreductase [Desulfobacterales bacterium]|nr:MAG: FAD-binding oxidoreductase [Desulfobacterales bacterium]
MKLSPNFKEIPYWLDPPPLTKSFSPFALPTRTDVLVIGSGYTGTAAAIRLKQAGLKVTIIDKLKLGTAASARNGGMTLTGLSRGLTKIEKKLGKDKAKQLFDESLESVNTVERLVAQGNINCDFQRCGHLETAFKPSHFESLKRDQEHLHKRYHHQTLVISPEELKTELDSDLYHGALLDPASAGLHPAKYITGLIAMADNLGVNMCEEVIAEAIEHRGSGFSIRTNRGTISADEVVVATNGYTGPLTPWLRRRLLPTESLMIATEDLPEDLAASLIPKGRMIYDTKIFLYYFRLSPDGRRLLFGGRPKSPRRTPRENAADMYRNMLRVYPRLRDVAITHAWSGKIGFTMNRLPHIGKHNGLYYALGYCGHGVALATYLGDKLAALVQGKDPDTAFTDLAFRAIPLYNGVPWFQPLVYYYFSLLDRII